MLSWTEQASLSEQTSRRVRALFGAMNFWAIIMYNLVSLNSLEFTELVARRLLLTGEGWGWGMDTESAKHQPQGLWALEMQPPTPQHPRDSSGEQGRWGRKLLRRGAAPRHRGSLPCTGFPQTTLAVLFVTYCGIQLIKERERTLALEEEKRDKEKLE